MKARSEELRKKRSSRPLSWYLAWAVIYLIIFSLTLCFILSLPVWRVKFVQVKGAGYFDPRKIASVAKVPMDENIFLIDPDMIRERFRNIVQIKKLGIKRKLPATIVIEVLERKPFAIAVIGDLTTMIDDEGVVIAKKSLATSMYRLEAGNLPVVRGIPKGSLIDSGKKISTDEVSILKDTIKLLSRFLDISTVQIDIGNKGDITIYVEDILKVKIGDKENMYKKIGVLSVLLLAEKSNITKMKYVDVSIPESPVIRYK